MTSSERYTLFPQPSTPHAYPHAHPHGSFHAYPSRNAVRSDRSPMEYMPHERRISPAYTLIVAYQPKVETARKNNAFTARLHDNLERPYAQGQFRYVARGVYISGARKGQFCVIKWHKAHHSLSVDPFGHDIKTAHAAFSIIDMWNAAGLIAQTVRVNMPVVWRLDNNMGRLAGKRVLVEPFITQFRKCNSNTGWADTSVPWARIMQALSHFSYDVSGGRSLVCDLQGGFYDDHAVVTDPVVCSTSRSYGMTDLGAKGISNFFARHRCNEYCRRSWRKPRNAAKKFTAVRSTYMISM